MTASPLLPPGMAGRIAEAVPSGATGDSGTWQIGDGRTPLWRVVEDEPERVPLTRPDHGYPVPHRCR